MGDRLQQLKLMELIRAMEKLGFVIRRQTGSHIVLRHPETRRMASIPIHGGDLKRGLLFGIIRQTGITAKQIRENL